MRRLLALILCMPLVLILAACTALRPTEERLGYWGKNTARGFQNFEYDRLYDFFGARPYLPMKPLEDRMLEAHNGRCGLAAANNRVVMVNGIEEQYTYYDCITLSPPDEPVRFEGR